MPTAAVYARQSFFKKDSCSIDMQVERAKAFCVSQGWDYIIYDVDKGYSGKDTDRPGFRQMMKDIKAGKIQFVVVYKLDRISRNLLDFFELMEEFKKYEVGFRSLTENFDTTTPMGRAMLALIAVFAQLERETTAERVRDNMLERARMGIWNGGPVPFGFLKKKTTLQIGGKPKKFSVLVHEDTENDWVLRFYHWYLEHSGSIRANVFRANQMGIPTKTGSAWNTNQMQRILSNPLYCIADKAAWEYFSSLGVEIASEKHEFDGKHRLMWYNRRKPHNKTTRLRDKTEWILAVGGHPGTIPGELFVQVQLKLAAKAERPARAGTGKKGLLAWLVKCGKCGKAMTYYDYKQSTWQYYKCSGKEQQSICSGQTAKGAELEQAVISAIKKTCADREFLEGVAREAMQEMNHSSEPLLEEKKRLAARLDELANEQKELIRALGKKTLPAELIEERVQEIERDKQPVAQRLGEIDIELESKDWQKVDMEMVFGNLLRFNEVFDELEFEEKRNFLRSIVKEIIYDEGKIRILIYFMPEITSKNPPGDSNNSDSFVMNPCPCITEVQESYFSLTISIEETDLPETTLGERLRKVRRNKGLSQKEVADQAGITQHTLRNWENDNHNPNQPSTLKRVVDVLGTSMEYLLGPISDKATFNEKLLYYRWCQGWNQKEMAQQIGVSPDYLAEAEKGKYIAYIYSKAIALDEEFFGPLLQ